MAVIFLLLAAMQNTAMAQVNNIINTQDPIVFQGEEYYLGYSHYEDGEYVQEYYLPGENSGVSSRIFLLKVVPYDSTSRRAPAALEIFKSTNTKFQKVRNNGNNIDLVCLYYLNIYDPNITEVCYTNARDTLIDNKKCILHCSLVLHSYDADDFDRMSNYLEASGESILRDLRKFTTTISFPLSTFQRLRKQFSKH